MFLAFPLLLLYFSCILYYYIWEQAKNDKFVLEPIAETLEQSAEQSERAVLDENQKRKKNVDLVSDCQTYGAHQILGRGHADESAFQVNEGYTAATKNVTHSILYGIVI